MYSVCSVCAIRFTNSNNVAINKPTGLSSAQVIRDLQTHFNPSELFAPWIESETKSRQKEHHNQRGRRKNKKIQVKIGHGGTLDPLATGVLITGIGKGTKSLQDFLMCTKVYEAVVLFGTATDTYDRVGKVLKRAPHEHITKEMVETALGQFRGKFQQLPPLFSALKMNGKPLYEYAREGKEIPREIERRPVEVLELEMIEWMEGGTHQHVAPTDEAGYAEVNVANKLWKQENALPVGKDSAKAVEGIPTKDADVVVKEEEPTEEKRDLDTFAGVDGVDSHLPVYSNQEGPSSSTVKVEEADASLAGDEGQIAIEDGGDIPKSDEGLVEFESTKRKLVEDQDDLIHERPASKQQKNATSSEDAIMSGGLAAPGTSDAAAPTSHNTTPETTSVKGPPAARLRMTVTSGFYVRSLCHDLGAAVGSAALMAELERSRQGDFELGKNVLDYSDLELGEEVWGPKVEAMLEKWHQDNKAPSQD